MSITIQMIEGEVEVERERGETPAPREVRVCGRLCV